MHLLCNCNIMNVNIHIFQQTALMTIKHHSKSNCTNFELIVLIQLHFFTEETAIISTELCRFQANSNCFIQLHVF